jgi:hypothetical protein
MRRLLCGLALWMAIGAAQATAERDPLNYPIKQYGFILGVALLGGLVSWAAKVRAGTLRAWNLMALVGELSTSAFAGLLCFWFCEWQSLDPLLTASLVGVAGHMGTRALILAERMAERKWGAETPPPPPAPPTL